MRVAVLAAMPMELRPFARMAGLRRDAHKLHRGKAGDADIVACLIGVGPASATSSCSELLDDSEIDHVVVIGITGGTRNTDRIGTLVVPERVVDGASGKSYLPASAGSFEAAGVMCSTDHLIVDEQEVSDLLARGVIALDMETAAVAAVCEERGVKWSVFRAVSDKVGDLNASMLLLLRPDGSIDLPAVCRRLVRRPWEMTRLVRLARGGKVAAEVAASAVLTSLPVLS